MKGKQLTIRGVSPTIHAALTRSAKENMRSLNAEALVALVAHVKKSAK